MIKYEYKLKYILLQNNKLVSYARRFKELQDLEHYLKEIIKKGYYVSSKKYKVEIKEIEIL